MAMGRRSAPRRRRRCTVCLTGARRGAVPDGLDGFPDAHPAPLGCSKLPTAHANSSSSCRRRYDGERHTIGAPPYGMRLGAGRGAVPLLCAAALLALCLPRVEAQHVDLVAPAQGFGSRDGSLRIEWVVAGVPGDGGAPHVVLMVNGMVAQVASATVTSQYTTNRVARLFDRSRQTRGMQLQGSAD